MENPVDKLKRKLQGHRASLLEMEKALKELESKSLTGIIKDSNYTGECFLALSDGVIRQSTLTSAYHFVLNQGRAFYDRESAERFVEHEQLQYELSCATKSGTDLYYLSWGTEDEELSTGYYSCLYVRFGFKSRVSAKIFASNYTDEKLKLMLGAGL